MVARDKLVERDYCNEISAVLQVLDSEKFEFFIESNLWANYIHFQNRVNLKILQLTCNVV